jgi:hypothetical protein
MFISVRCVKTKLPDFFNEKNWIEEQCGFYDLFVLDTHNSTLYNLTETACLGNIWRVTVTFHLINGAPKCYRKRKSI